MNTCIKCGCDDAYPSLPPCPVPAACPNPQPCSEVFDAQCIVFTLPDIECGEDIVVAQDDTVAEALDGIVSYFCAEISILTTAIANINIALGDTVQSVTGLNTDNTDPQNPIVRISVDGTTITGLGTPASPLVAIGGGGSIGGSGIQDYVARWTPDGSTLGTGTIRDDGSRVGIGVAPGALGGTYKVYVRTTNDVVGLTAEQKTVAGSTDKVALQAIASGSGGAGINIGLNALGSGSTTQNTGVYVGATSTGAASSLGGFLYASGGVTNNAVKLVDGTEGIGKVLTCVTADGMANWVAPATGVAGSGINNYVARWTPDGTTLGTGLIRDNNDTVAIGTTLDTNTFFRLSTSKVAGMVITNTNTTNVIRNAIYASTNGISSAENRGIEALAMNSTLLNTGVAGNAISDTGSKAVGGAFSSAGAGTNYAVQLRDGTQGAGKVLTCMTADGEANWNKVTSTYTTGASGSFVIGAQTITVTNGLITSIV
jgi:hypothetical protein